MPRLITSPLPYSPRGKKVKSIYLETLCLDEPGSNGKAFVVTKPELAKDYQLIGEIAIIVRPEDVAQTKTLFYTADSLIRGYQPIHGKMVERIQIIQDDIDFLDQTSSELFSNWQSFKEAEIGLASFLLKLKAIRLISARSTRRKNAGDRIGNVVDFKDSLGRPNPLIASTVLLAVSRKLSEQHSFDLKSLKSIENWGLLAESLARTISDDTEQLFHLLNRPASLVSSQLPKFLRRLWIKPMIYASLFARWEITNSGLSRGRDKIRAAFVAEMAMIDLSSALSSIRNHPDSFSSNMANLLEFAMSDVDIHDCYQQLFAEVKQILPLISHDYASGDIVSGRKRIGKVKSLIRNRLIEDEDSPWSLQNALATP